MGVTRKDNHHDPQKMYDCAREIYDRECPRNFCVLDPLKVTIVNLKEPLNIECPNFPQEKWTQKVDGRGNIGLQDATRGTYTVPLAKTLYIDRKDFKEDANPKKYFGLTKKTPIRLKYAYKI